VDEVVLLFLVVTSLLESLLQDDGIVNNLMYGALSLSG